MDNGQKVRLFSKPFRYVFVFLFQLAMSLSKLLENGISFGRKNANSSLIHSVHLPRKLLMRLVKAVQRLRDCGYSAVIFLVHC